MCQRWRTTSSLSTYISTHLGEELPDVTDKKIGCLHGGEVSAPAEFGPVHHRVLELDGAPVRHIQREHGDPGGHGRTLTRAPWSAAARTPVCYALRAGRPPTASRHRRTETPAPTPPVAGTRQTGQRRPPAHRCGTQPAYWASPSGSVVAG